MDKNEDVKASIRQIITESIQNEMNDTPDGSVVFNIQRYIDGLLGEGKKNPSLMSYLMRYDERIKHGGKQFMMFESFGTGLRQFSTGNKNVKEVLKKMDNILDENFTELCGFKLIEDINDEYVRESVRESYNRYIAEPCDETRNELLEEIDNLRNFNPGLADMFIVNITETANERPYLFGGEVVNEQQQAEIERKRDEFKQKKLTNNIFKKVERYIDQRLNESEIKKNHINEKFSLTGIANHNGLNLAKRIKSVLASDAGNNDKLKNVLSEYANALANGAYEERLYETLLQNTSMYNYLLPVDKMRKDIKKVVEKNQESIALTKLLEEMRDSYSSYIYVELIQEDVARYVLNPNATNRVQLRNALMPYAHDPYISAMFDVIYQSDSIKANSISEKAISIKEEIDIIRQNATVSPIYTPVQYIRENESIFNVNGQYFVKKGNIMSVLDKKYISHLDERFVELCHLVNDPHVHICDDHIDLIGTDYSATIYEGYVDINGYKEDRESLRRLDEMCIKYDNYDTNFYIMCSCLLENFNNIARIDWAKHISLNSNTDITADLFKLDENIYMATHNNALMKHTFYRNVNPIFCKNTLNEHMGINVSSLFGDLLPNQDKIILRLNETKNEYEKSIEEYTQAIEDLKAAKEEATTDEIKKEITDMIDDSKQKLKDIKDEYKQWQKDNDEALATKKSDDDDEEDDENTKTETSNEPVSADEAEAMKDELSQPVQKVTGDEDIEIPAGYDGSTADGEYDADDATGEISDAEFDDYLDGAGSGNAEEDGVTDADTAAINSLATQYGGDDEPAEDTDSVSDQEVDDIVNDIEDGSDATDDEEFQEVDTEDVDNLDDEPAETEVDAEELGDEYVDGDDIFDETDEEGNDEISDEPAAEDVPSDEDIIIGDDFGEENNDNLAGMETVDAETGETDEEGSEATDIFGGDVEDPIDLNKEVDTELFNPHVETPDYSIVNVMFDGNVKNSTVMKSGTVLVLKPVITADGSKDVENVEIKFYLSGDDNTPILDMNEKMSTSMYNSIINAITSHPQYADVCANGVTVSSADAVVTDDIKTVDAGGNDDDWENEYIEDGNDEDKGIFTIGDEEDTDDDVNFDIDTDEVDAAAGIENDDDNLPPADVDDTETIEIDDNGDEDLEIDGLDDEDDFDFGDIFGDLGDDVDAVDAVDASVDTATDPVDTYTDAEGTEIEVPAEKIGNASDDEAEDADENIELDDVIPESYKRRRSGKRINEKRSILSIKKVRK